MGIGSPGVALIFLHVRMAEKNSGSTGSSGSNPLNHLFLKPFIRTTGLNMTGSILVHSWVKGGSVDGMNRCLRHGTSHLGWSGSSSNPVVARSFGVLEPENHQNQMFLFITTKTSQNQLAE